MTGPAYRYTFARGVPPGEAADTLALAVLAAESLHGAARVRLDAARAFDPADRTCTIAAGTPAGDALNQLFVGFLTREFGPAAVAVERVGPARPEPVPA